MKRWEDSDEEDFEGGGEEEFWMEFNDAADVANMIAINRQQEFDLAHKSINMEILDKAIKINKSRWLWWIFSSQKTRMKAISYTYRILIGAVHKSL
jgi:hypothetical protein